MVLGLDLFTVCILSYLDLLLVCHCDGLILSVCRCVEDNFRIVTRVCQLHVSVVALHTAVEAVIVGCEIFRRNVIVTVVVVVVAD